MKYCHLAVMTTHWDRIWSRSNWKLVLGLSSRTRPRDGSVRRCLREDSGDDDDGGQDDAQIQVVIGRLLHGGGLDEVCDEAKDCPQPPLRSYDRLGIVPNFILQEEIFEK